MKLISLYIENFGGLSQYSLDFEDGITIVLQPNGFGKTTLAEFIRAMFYGFPRKSKTLEKSLRQKYTPWNGGRFGGNLVFEEQGQRYRVERTFGTTPKGDTFTLIDLSTNRKSTRFSEELGQELFGLDADSFERSTYLPQLQEEGPLATASIQAKLTALMEDSSDVANFDKAIAALRTKRSALIPYRGSGGSVVETAAQISRLQLELDQAKSQEAQLYAAQEETEMAQQEVETLQRQLDEICVELETASRQAENYRQQQEYVLLCSRHRKTTERIASCRKTYPGGLPREEELRRAESAADRLQETALPAYRLKECRALCEEYESLQRQLEEAAREKERHLEQTGKPRAAVAWMLTASAFLAGGVLAFLKEWIPAIAVFALGLIIWTVQSRKMRAQRREQEKKQFALQSKMDGLRKSIGHCGRTLDAIFAQCGLNPQPHQFFDALTQLERSVSRNAQQEAELNTFFAKLGLAEVSDAHAVLRQLREDIHAIQAAEAFAKELETQIEMMEKTCGESLCVELPAGRDPAQLRETEQHLRKKLAEATSRMLRAKQSARFLQTQLLDIPQLQEEIGYCQQKLQEDRKNAELLDATVEFLQQARENLSTAYLGTIRTRFGYYLSQLQGSDDEKYLIDTAFQVQLERFGKARELAYFSAGQTDLILLCMRLALVDALFKEQSVIIVLDDPFVNLDDEHLAKARKLLHMLPSNRQILYLTCHSSRTA